MNNKSNTDTKLGRPFGANAYGESTIPIRVPKSKVTIIKDYLNRAASSKDEPELVFFGLETPARKLSIPLYSSIVPAGFPSPCDDHVEKRLNIHEYLVDNEDATFIVEIGGLSMINAGLYPKDKAVIDRSKTAQIGNIVMASVDGEFTIKQLGIAENGNPLLIPANPDFNVIEIKEGMDFQIWGVMTSSFRKYL